MQHKEAARAIILKTAFQSRIDASSGRNRSFSNTGGGFRSDKSRSKIRHAAKIIFEIRIAVAVGILGAVGRILWIQSMAAFPSVGHAVVIGIVRCGKRTEFGPAAHGRLGVYQAFAADTFMDLAGQHPQLIVMRTLSKIGLAGLRLGYAAGAPDVIAQLDKVRPPYNVRRWRSTKP